MLTARDAIIVPRGAERKAIERGTSGFRGSRPRVIGIPIGFNYPDLPRKYPDITFTPEMKIVITGLAGSLHPDIETGAGVIYEGCGNDRGEYFPTDAELTANIAALTGYRLVRGWTGDRVIVSASEKIALGKRTGYDVVDMEGTGVMAALRGYKVAIVRVISDSVDRDLPDMTGTIDPEGNLKPLALAGRMLREPIPSYHLIRGSLKGLRVLESLADRLCSGS